MFDLDRKTAIVTGGARGIGAGIVRALASAGATVVIADLDTGDVAASGILNENESISALQVDVADAGEVSRLFSSVMATHGSIDIVVNNAGTSSPEEFLDITPESWDRLLSINAKSSFLCAQAGLRAMMGGGGGRIIQVTSVTAHQGALHGHAHYAASKSAQIGLTKTLSRVAAPYAVTVNAIAPGVIETPLSRATLGTDILADLATTIPLGLGSVDDVGFAAVFLASDEARYITGVTLDINGGQYIR